MSRALSLTLLRLVILVALATSVALFVDYSRPESAFCAAAGCGAVKHSGYGYFFGNPVLNVPLLGALGFGALFSISLMSASRARDTLLLVGNALGGLGALVFIFLQAAVIGSFCWMCMIVDVAAIVAAGVAVLWKFGRGPDRELYRPLVWVGLSLLAVAAPLLWPRLRPAPPVPDPVAALYQPGKINVVEFADFECPFCRKLHPELKQVIEEFGERVHFVRQHKPLGSHQHARAAARAAICAEAQGQAGAMADWLFATRDLRAPSMRQQAGALGCDLSKYDDCVLSPATDARIERESARLSGDDFLGLPTTFVQGQKILGYEAPAVFRDALRRAARGEGDRGVPAWLYFGLVAVGAVAWLGLGRARARIRE